MTFRQVDGAVCVLTAGPAGALASSCTKRPRGEASGDGQRCRSKNWKKSSAADREIRLMAWIPARPATGLAMAAPGQTTWVSA